VNGYFDYYLCQCEQLHIIEMVKFRLCIILLIEFCVWHDRSLKLSATLSYFGDNVATQCVIPQNIEILDTLAMRTIKIFDKDHFEHEKDYLTKVFKRIIYKNRDIKRGISREMERIDGEL
jgi:hypothetical protein